MTGMNVDPNEVLKAVGDNLPVKEAYADALKPAMAELGIGLGTLAGTIRLALIPLEFLVYKGDQIREKFMPDLENRLETVPPHRIQTPAPEVAGPIFEALRFTAQNDELRRMYANLLGTAMDSETARSAHPAFVEVLKQITPDEARAWREIGGDLPAKYMAMIEVRNLSGDMYRTDLSHFLDAKNCEYPDLIPTYVTNWIRLGLIEVIDGTAADESYKEIEEHELIVRARSAIESVEGHTAELHRSACAVTPFGEQFVAACVSPTVGTKA